MRRDLLSFCLIAALLVLSACAPEPVPEPEPAAEPEPVAAAEPAAADPSGTWTGDWGPSPDDRNDVTLEMTWDGMSLMGIINPDTAPVEIANATFDPATGAITMEADVDANGTTVHYMIEGQLDGDSMTGSWSHDDREGDFSITRSE